MDSSRILLVEKNEKVRALMRDHLKTRGYEIVEANDGLEAAKKMREAPPDLILIDQRVNRGGIRIARLFRLHPTYQQIPILVTVDRNKAVSSLIAEGKKLHIDTFLVKPCTRAVLEKKIQENLRAQLPKLSMPEIRAEIAQLTYLPVLSPNHRKMLNLLAKDDTEVDVPELARTIEADHGMATRVLRICHSAYYGFRGNTIEGAITFLGIDKLRKIVHAAIVFDVFSVEEQAQEKDGFSMLGLWKHSVACGVVMEEGGHRVKGRDHFVAGMLHDVGKVILHLRFPEYFEEILRRVREKPISMYRAEKELIGITHADIGYELARKWELPPTIGAAIVFHHVPSEALQHRRMASLVHLSDILVRSLNIGHGGDRQKMKMDSGARPLAKYVLALANRKDEILTQVESMLFDEKEEG